MCFGDIHTHILYGVDDGARDIDMALDMLKTAYETGTRVLFMTPHLRNRELDIDTVKSHFLKLCEKSNVLFPELKLYLGCELFYRPCCIGNDVMTLAGSDYVLTEFHPDVSEGEIMSAISEITSKGLLPVIAHIERYHKIDCNSVFRLIDSGAYIQINADSITGNFFLKRRVKKLLQNRIVHFVASDAHDLNNRVPVLEKGYDIVCKNYGSDYADAIFSKNAVLVYENKII